MEWITDPEAEMTRILGYWGYHVHVDDLLENRVRISVFGVIPYSGMEESRSYDDRHVGIFHTYVQVRFFIRENLPRWISGAEPWPI